MNGNTHFTVEVGGHVFYTEEEYQLPLLSDSLGYKKEIGSNTEIDLDAEYDEEEFGGYSCIREVLEDNDFVICEDTYIFESGFLNEIDTFSFDHGNTSVTFYSLPGGDDETLVYIVWDKMGSYYYYDCVKDMINMYANEVEIWHQGNDEIKSMYFSEDELLEIETIVGEKDSNTIYKIVKSKQLEVPDPAYYFNYVGITTDNELVIYDVGEGDRSDAELFTLEELIERNKKGINAFNDEFYGNGYFPDNEDIETIKEFLEENSTNREKD